jgi:hypothetical protein
MAVTDTEDSVQDYLGTVSFTVETETFFLNHHHFVMRRKKGIRIAKST